MKSEKLAALRYVSLVKQLRDEEGAGHGWKTAVARKLGINPSYITKLLDEERLGVGIRAIEEAVRSLGLRREFFYDDGPVEMDYHDYLGDPAPEDLHPALREFLESPAGAGVDDWELEQLRRVRFKGEPTPRQFALLLMALRDG